MDPSDSVFPTRTYWWWRLNPGLVSNCWQLSSFALPLPFVPHTCAYWACLEFPPLVTLWESHWESWFPWATRIPSAFVPPEPVWMVPFPYSRETSQTCKGLSCNAQSLQMCECFPVYALLISGVLWTCVCYSLKPCCMHGSHKGCSSWGLLKDSSMRCEARLNP